MPGITPDDGAIDDGGVPGGDDPEPDLTPVTVDLAVALFTSQNAHGARPGSVVLAREPGHEWGTEEERLFLIIPDVTMTVTQRANLFRAAGALNDDKFLGTVDLTALMTDAAPAQADEYMTNMLDACQTCQPFITDGVNVPANVMDHLTISEGQMPP